MTGAPEGVRVLRDGTAVTTVSALERGLHYGDGLFETIACPAGRPRLLQRHLARLAAGCDRLGIPAPSPGPLTAEIRALAGRGGHCVVKVLVTRGPAQARGYGPTGAEHPSRLVLCYPWAPDDPAAAKEGVRVRLGTLRLGENPALAGLKHCNRLEQVLARREWTDPQIAESLLFSHSGALVSGTMSNVFLLLEGVLCTPRLDTCGVAGVMRGRVLEQAASAGLRVAERRLDAADLARAEEVFLTNALIGIRPVRAIDGRTLAVGELTRRLQAQQATLPDDFEGGGAVHAGA